MLNFFSFGIDKPTVIIISSRDYDLKQTKAIPMLTEDLSLFSFSDLSTFYLLASRSDYWLVLSYSTYTVLSFYKITDSYFQTLICITDI